MDLQHQKSPTYKTVDIHLSDEGKTLIGTAHINQKTGEALVTLKNLRSNHHAEVTSYLRTNFQVNKVSFF